MDGLSEEGESVPLSLRDPRHPVSRRAPLLWALQGSVLAVVVTVALVSAVLGLDAVPAWALVVVLPLVAAYVVAMPLVRYRVHRWETTDGAVYTQSGWLARERRIAPMSRVQTVDLSQGPLQQLLGLATVTVTTASAAGPLQIAEVDLPVALRLVAELTQRAEAEHDDAT